MLRGAGVPIARTSTARSMSMVQASTGSPTHSSRRRASSNRPRRRPRPGRPSSPTRTIRRDARAGRPVPRPQGGTGAGRDGRSVPRKLLWGIRSTSARSVPADESPSAGASDRWVAVPSYTSRPSGRVKPACSNDAEAREPPFAVLVRRAPCPRLVLAHCRIKDILSHCLGRGRVPDAGNDRDGPRTPSRGRSPGASVGLPPGRRQRRSAPGDSEGRRRTPGS